MAGTLEDGLVISYKTKPILTRGSGNPVPYYLPKGAEKLHLYKNLRRDVYKDLIIIAQTWK